MTKTDWIECHGGEPDDGGPIIVNLDIQQDFEMEE